MWPWISKAIGGAAVNHDRLQLRAHQLRMVVSLMNYPIIWPNSGDGSRQRNLGTGNRKKLCFVISIQHLAQLTRIHSAARRAIRVSLMPAPPQSHSCLERRTSAISSSSGKNSSQYWFILGWGHLQQTVLWITPKLWSTCSGPSLSCFCKDHVRTRSASDADFSDTSALA